MPPATTRIRSVSSRRPSASIRTWPDSAPRCAAGLSYRPVVAAAGGPPRRSCCEALADGGEDTVTLAPETGRDSTRARLSKPFTNEQVLDGCRMARAAGIRRCASISWPASPARNRRSGSGRRAGRSSRPGLAGRAGDGRLPVTVSLSPFVPKPNTPFQYAAMHPLPELRATLRRYAAAIHRRGVDAQIGSARDAHLQWRLATGSRVTGKLLQAVVEGRAEPADLIDERSPFTARPFIAAPDRRPPWAVTTWGLSEDCLAEEWRRFLSGDLTPPCSGLPDCIRCGICENPDPSCGDSPRRPADPEPTR